jgi:hypothetical protein
MGKPKKSSQSFVFGLYQYSNTPVLKKSYSDDESHVLRTEFVVGRKLANDTTDDHNGEDSCGPCRA